MERWPLVGRDEELALLRAALLGGDGCGVVIGGAAGVGKTRLVAELLDGLDVHVVRVTATQSLATIPLGAVAALLPAPVPLDRGADALASAVAAFRAMDDGRPLLVSVDDAHLLDPASAGLVHQLITAGLARAVLTTRSGAVMCDAVRSLWKDEGALYVELQPLSDDDVEVLLDEVLDGVVASNTRRRLTDASGGNPLLLHELVQASLASEVLSNDAGVWVLSGPPEVGMRLVDLVSARLDGVLDADRTLLELLAVGEPLGVPLVDDVAPGADAAALEAAGLVAVTADGRRTELRLGHPLYGEVLRQAMGVLTRRQRCTALADAIDERGAARRDDLLRVASWRLEAGGAMDASRLLAAARIAIVHRDHALGERLARAAAEAGAGPDALIEIVESLYWQDRHAEALRLLDAVDLDALEDAKRVRAMIQQSSMLFWGMQRPDDAIAVLVAARAREADGHRALIEHLCARPASALALADEVLADPDSDLRAQVRAAGARVEALALTTQPARALEEAATWLAAALPLVEEDPTLPGSVLMGQLLGLLLTGNGAEFDALGTALYESASSADGDQYRGLWAFVAGRGALLCGDLDRAAARLREAAGALPHGDVGRVLPWCLGVLAQCEGQRGDAHAAASAAAEALAHEGAIAAWRTELRLGAAWAKAAAGEVTAALVIALDAAEEARACGHRATEALVLHDAIRLGARDEAAARLAALDGLVEGPIVDAARRRVLAVKAHDGKALDELSAEWAARGALLLAAECAAEAATAHAATGRTGSRAASRARALELLASCPGAVTPSLRGVEAPELALLTEREREVAGLAARGLTRKDIADRLFLSSRTVGNHLNHIYGKLGVQTRDELADLLRT